MKATFKIFTLLLIISMLTLSGCSESSDYSLERIDGKLYICFDDIEKYRDMNEEKAEYSFESIEILADAVQSGTLSDEHKIGLMRFIDTTFEMDKSVVEICDFKKMSYPMLPAGVSIENIYWFADSYEIILKSNAFSFGQITIIDKKQYYDGIETQIKAEKIISESFNESKNVQTIEYFDDHSTYRQIRYYLNDGQKNILVEETYTLSTTISSIHVSETIPTLTILYICDNDAYCKVQLQNHSQLIPSEFLSSFGLETRDLS